MESKTKASDLERVKERPNDHYDEFEAILVDNFTNVVRNSTPVFKTNAEGLWDLYLNNIAEEGRQHYNCNCCRHFIETYGSLVTVNADGTLKSLLWDIDVPPFFRASVEALNKAVKKSVVTTMFESDERMLGNAKTGVWTHLHVQLPFAKVNKSRVKTAGQLMAESKENYRMLSRAIADYDMDTVNKAVALLNSETLYRGDTCLGVATWFKGILNSVSTVKSSNLKKNLVWLQVSQAKAGYCHVNSSMIGTLLDDIASGMDTTSVKNRFASKMNAGSYMRSQSAPTEGAIEQAEKLVAKLGIADSLERRYATIDEIEEFLWKPAETKKQSKVQTASTYGIFGNITPKGQTKKNNDNSSFQIPTTTMTWDKFKRTVLPTAESIEARVNASHLMALVTAVHPESENILQWDNPFSWYYHAGIDSDIRRRLQEHGATYEGCEIRCSLSWDNGSDLDIHCITPNGGHIYYGTRGRRINGGSLDIDANAGGISNWRKGVDDDPIENIRWTQTAPNGRYQFYVHNFSDQNGRYNPYKVELEVNGKIYSYEGIAGGTGYKEVVFEFDYRNGEVSFIVNLGSESSNTSNWNLESEFVPVTGITVSPNLWGNNNVLHSGNHTFFLLDGCEDLTEGKGRGFFTEMLKPELHEIRKTLEAYTAQAPIDGVDNASACGLGYNKDNDQWDLILKVNSEGNTRYIKIDRWD